VTSKAAWTTPWSLAVLVALGYAVICLFIDVAHRGPHWNASAIGAIAEIIALASGALAWVSTRSSRTIVLFWICSSILWLMIGTTLCFLWFSAFVAFFERPAHGWLAAGQALLLVGILGYASPVLVVQWVSYRYADRRYRQMKLPGVVA
jgi:hypothetical protein